MVSEALGRLPDNNYEAAGILGVAEGTIRRWRDGKVPAQLRAETRRALERFLDGEAGNGGQRRAEHEGLDTPGVAGHPTIDDRQFFDEVRAILRDQDITPGLRVLLIDAATSAYSKAALYRGAVAEEERARAVHQAERTQQARTKVIARVEEMANERFKSLREDQREPKPTGATPSPYTKARGTGDGEKKKKEAS